MRPFLRLVREVDFPPINILLLTAQLLSTLSGFSFIFTKFLVQYLGLSEKISRAPLRSWESLIDSEGARSSWMDSKDIIGRGDSF